MRRCLSARTLTSRAPFRVLRCCATAGGLSLQRLAISPDDSAPDASISIMRWRVGSAKADREFAVKAFTRLYLRIYLIKSIRKLMAPRLGPSFSYDRNELEKLAPLRATRKRGEGGLRPRLHAL